jgi:AcrR family transcriptional regulator
MPPEPSGRARPGPKPRLSRPIIADAALGVGFESLTMAAVAGRLGVATSALYRYVADRDDLVVAAADRLFDVAPPITGDHWREVLVREVELRWDALIAHPGVIGAVEAAGRPIPAAFARFGALVRHLEGLGFSPEDAYVVADSVLDLVDDGITNYVGLLALNADQSLDAVVEAQTEVLGARFEPVVREVYRDLRRFFDRKLDLLLDGVATRWSPPR